MDYWSPYSRIIRAESRTGPQGHYVFAEQVVGTFSHNPTVIWSQGEGKYLMYYIGCPQEVALDKACAAPSFKCGPGNYINGESGISVASSTNLREWKIHGGIFMGDDSANWDAVVTNPSPFPLYQPGNQSNTILLTYRGCPVNCRDNYEWINIASSPSGFLGPYTKLDSEPIFKNSNEDPFIWRDKRGNWHMLLHSLEAGGGFGDGPNVGRHAFSRNWEGPWTYNTKTLAYTTTIDYDDGFSIDFLRRERPQLFFSEDGEMTPLYLTTGVQPKLSPQAYTAIVPIGDSGKNDILKGKKQASKHDEL